MIPKIRRAGDPARQCDEVPFAFRVFEAGIGRDLDAVNPDVIRDTVAYAKEKAEASNRAVGFTMTTNLTLLTEEMAEFLAENAFHVMVSLDGDREGNDQSSPRRSCRRCR